MKLLLLFMLAGLLHLSAASRAQTVTLKGKNLSITAVLNTIQQQTGYRAFGDMGLLSAAHPITVNAKDMPLEEFLTVVLRDQSLVAVVADKTIIIKSRDAFQETTEAGNPGHLKLIQQERITVNGTVSDTTGLPLVGATVRVLNTDIQTVTDQRGHFVLHDIVSGALLEITMLGYVKQAGPAAPLVVFRLLQTDESIGEVVVTGLFERKQESFTGSTTTFTQKELLEQGNLNVVKSLANLDPSFRIMENLEFGSDPNRLPEIHMRGQTGLPDLNNEYGANPNIPLFILDGFETDLQRITDLDIYLVKSITLLKDASSKAVYGSRAANGVVVIETLRPPAGKLQVTYNYNLNVELPDLTSYNLANSAQKLEIEMLTDPELINPDWPTYSDSWFHSVPARLIYDKKREEILRGVNTYWLSQPLRNGFGNRHSLTLGGGRDELQYYVEMGYNDIRGVMKGSEREIYSGGIQLSYRKRAISVNNIVRFSSTRGENSPYGGFQQFADANPYVRLDSDSTLLNQLGPEWYQLIPTIYRFISIDQSPFVSPMHNGTIGVKDFNTEGSITNNTDLIWRILPSLRLNWRLGLSRTTQGSDVFLPADHTSFPQSNPNSVSGALRGSYTKTSSFQNRLNTSFVLSYNRSVGRNTLYANAGLDANSFSTNSYGFEVVGFPNANLSYPAAAAQYAQDSRLSGTENKTRDMGGFAAVNYSFDDRYLADLSWRLSRSSQFGPENPSAQYWSTGLGWNLHNENFMRGSRVFDMLRITGNVGYTGSQPVNAYIGIPLYRYQLANLYYGEYSLSLINMANPFLGAQRKLDKNISLSMGLLDNRLNFNVDYYNSTTDGLLIDISLPNSTGFPSFKANQGEVENQGIDLRVNYQIYQNLQKGDFLTVHGTMGRNKNTLKELSNTLIALTSSQDNILSPALKQRFEVGASINTIWAVPSMGIDPATGREVFLKKDGTTTFDWDAADQVAAGDALPELYGNFGFSVRHSGWQLNTSFAYNLGGKKYNTTLANKVENIDPTKNVDARVLTSRWKQPGDITFFKGITDFGPTYPTTRFVEDWNDLTLATVNLTYDLERLEWIKRAGIGRLRAGLMMNNAVVWSSIRVERGTSYPFARTFSFTLQTNF